MDIAAKPLERCGEVVAWSIRDYVSRESLDKALRDQGLAVQVKRTDKRTYLKRAIKECIENDVLREIGEDDHQIAYAIVEEDTDVSTASWMGSMKEAIVLDKKTGDINLRDAGKKSPLLASIIRAMDRNEGGLVAHEIGITIRRVIEKYCDAVPLRDTGGVYFVPQKDIEVLNALVRAIKEVESRNGSIRLRRFSVAMTDNSADSIRDLITLTIDKTSRRVRAEADELVKETKSKPYSFKNRIKTIAEAADTLRVYESILDETLREARARVISTRKILKKRLKQCVRQRRLSRIKKQEG